ncbi:hypothetical protein ACT17Q_13310 [Cellulomonas sp. CW35]|uniref:Uncharacterized protein n=1 Tax=Cellulomonas uda TaxID=1714 RepID=A0A4Y3KBK4_CELUD|nr:MULTISPECIES: hypothetical protein [Cellulomonas]ASR56503.1 hypothetical protein CBP52_16945 [Cellulomonas sp. PSBB021]NII67543.1 hypothetical protein [Cellulomonas uda]GEA81377.1 hypothetical protein CUD01_18210 [Cellulomonas uda]
MHRPTARATVPDTVPTAWSSREPARELLVMSASAPDRWSPLPAAALGEHLVKLEAGHALVVTLEVTDTRIAQVVRAVKGDGACFLVELTGDQGTHQVGAGPDPAAAVTVLSRVTRRCGHAPVLRVGAQWRHTARTAPALVLTWLLRGDVGAQYTVAPFLCGGSCPSQRSA